MNPWLLVCLVACFAVAWAPTVHAQGAFEDCCLAYHRRARLSLLRHAQSYHRQDVSGSCNLPAVIFFLPQKNKMVCGRPGARWVQAGMKILDARKKSRLKYHHSTRRNFQGQISTPIPEAVPGPSLSPLPPPDPLATGTREPCYFKPRTCSRHESHLPE
ncbi:C-C motif chemokine 25 isoform X2 [Bubalus bubalis]|uniref:C-C motif chemokine 25 isoform X2 n=1 Tax=Bubalus bubalis TaxID=89462 RepID=UPI00042CDBDD|nr:C-C motif chemokine 25 isoform X2 [Bubalus bubalis]